MRASFDRHKDVIAYSVCGLLTTLVNLAAYALLARVIGVGYLVSNAFAWVAAVAFAFASNKFFVFGSRVTSSEVVLYEMTTFVSARVVSGLLDMGLMYTLVGLASLDDVGVKVFVNGVVIVLNYLFSKHVVFGGRHHEVRSDRWG